MDTQEIVKTFSENVESVNALVNFENQVMRVAIDGVQALHESLVKTGLKDDSKNGGHTLRKLKSIKNTNTLKSSYQIIQNQAIVLLVSYFGSAVSDLFRVSSTIAVKTHNDKRVLGADLRLKVSDVIELGTVMGEDIYDLLIAQHSTSFQDMKSINRDFDEYFGITIDNDKVVNNIILGQACRYNIVHEGARVNNRVVNKVSTAKPRDLKQTLQLGETVKFTEEEIQTLADSMFVYVQELAVQVERYGNN